MSSVKLLDFGVAFQGDAQMARPRRIAWPVKAFRVTLPAESRNNGDGLNPFEILLIKLLEIDGPVSDAKLSEETCIPEDFVRGVLLRLQDKGYVDSRNNVLSKTSKRSDYSDFKPAFVFQELVAGKLLPFVSYNTQPVQRVVDTGLYCWQMQKLYRDHTPIKPDDVRKVMQEQRRRSRAYGDATYLPEARAIRVSEGNEYYYLDCPIGMRSSDGEFRIGNPFGKGYSLELEKIFIERIREDDKLEGWISGWRESLSRESATEKTVGDQPYETPRNKRLYPRLISSLKPNRFGFRTIESIYSSIEWALFYANEKTSSRNAVNLLRISKESDSPMIVRRAAQEIGLDTPERGYLRIHEQSLESYLEEVPEMPTAFAIAVLTAKSDESHPLRQLAASRPDAAIQLYRIKRERDNRSHGRGREAQDGAAGMNEAFMKELVSTLIPEIRFDADDGEAVVSTNAYTDSRFEARTSLLNRFGYATFNMDLDPMTQDRLMDAESFWASFSEGDNGLPFVGDLYAALQSELSRRVEVTSIRASSDGELSAAIRRRSDELGISPLPPSLSTVRPANIRKALQGYDETTLGALAVAFMLNNDVGKVARLISYDASFFTDVGEIIDARGHLNEARPFTKHEVDELRELAYKSIEALTEE